jgi:hypothetical protein
VERNFQSYLLDIAREDAASKEAELHSLRNSLRYRVGGWALEAFPPGRRTFVVLWRLARLCTARMRGRGASGKPGGNLVLSEGALSSSTLVFGTALPTRMCDSGAAWRTDNAQLMALRLDSGAFAKTLIVRVPDGMVLRRIARAKLQGTKVVWWPESSTGADSALISYIRTHADECRDAAPA